MKAIIVYGSMYGTTESYAKELAKQTGTQAVAYNAAGDLSEYDTVVYLGGIYKGILGLDKTAKKFNANQKIVVVSVGLADTQDAANRAKIQGMINEQLPQGVTAAIFCLKGGMDYQSLKFPHKILMTLIHAKAGKVAPEQRDAEQAALYDAYKQQTNFVDFTTLDEIVKALA